MLAKNRLYVLEILISFILSVTVSAVTVERGQIVVGDNTRELERYAAKELQRYLYQISGKLLPIVSDSSPIDIPSFVVGQDSTHKVIKRLRKSGNIPLWKNNAVNTLLPDSQRWGYIGSNTQTNVTTTAMPGALHDPDPMDAVPYHEERSNLDGYVFTVPNGKYRVKLYFADMTSREASQRVFDIYIESECQTETLDIFYRVNRWAELAVEYKDIKVEDGELNIDFHRRIGEPTVSAIAIEGNSYSIKVNCGGMRHGDWLADQAQPGDGPAVVTRQQGFVIKSLRVNNNPVVCIAGNDAEGVLYGVYSLLSDCYKLGFYMTGDVLPEKSELTLPDLEYHGGTRQKIRGFLPWTNFPQSATSYSLRDYQYIIDQMARMRMNFLFIHDYTGTNKHNEMFTNIDYNGVFERVWFATVRRSHNWPMPDWLISEYPFASYDLFDDYDFGSDAAKHNETLDDRQVFEKGVALFQQVIKYAHKRGVKVGLGVDIDSFPAYYKCSVDDPGLSRARADQIIRDYPDLDYFIAFRGEGLGEGASEIWDNIFRVMYESFKQRAPRIKLAVSGWGVHGDTIKSIPTDVVIAPIAPYSAACATGAEYPKHEYWGIPWLERDFKSSMWFYPYRCDLSHTIGAYQRQNSNMNGFLCLTWRVAGAVDAKLGYIAQAPWDIEGRIHSSEVLYRHYATNCYGAEIAEEITKIINQNEPFAPDGSESNNTYQLSGASRPDEITKAKQQIGIIESAMSEVRNPESKRRLDILKARIESTFLMNELDAAWPSLKWENLPFKYDRLTNCFDRQVEDISSLGNLTSFTNRLTKDQYIAKVNSCRNTQEVKAPSYVKARGIKNGAVITWRNEQPDIVGFNVYRSGRKINTEPLPAQARMFEDTSATGEYLYSVSAVAADGKESPLSVPSHCFAGGADNQPPRIVVISPPVTAAKGQHIDMTARVLDNRSYDSISAMLYYRCPGTSEYRKMQMSRRCKAVFGARIVAGEIGDNGVEYYMEISDGGNTSFYPASAPAVAALVTLDPHTVDQRPGKIEKLICENQMFWWTPADGNVHQYNIYRSQDEGFSPGPDNYLTYVAGSTTSFKDVNNDYWDRPKQGTYYYRVASVNQSGLEGEHSSVCSIDYHDPPSGLLW